MFCSKCGKQINVNSGFCPSCGNPINNVNYQNVNYQNFNYQNVNYQNQVNNKPKKPIGKIVTVSVLALCLIGLVVYALIGNNPYNSKKRTVMIYVDGSNLETDSAIVTADIAAIDPSKIDLENTNILIYAGGTKKWHNFIKNDENGIYLLTASGFQQLESYPQKSMGDTSSLTEFLNYSYDNYPAGQYNLIMYDHGGAVDGAIYDDFTNDHLTVEEFTIALQNSRFNSKNKLQSVIFRTCLNGTLEVADAFKDYAKYLIASEEITFGHSSSNVLSFLNNITIEDDAIEVGKKFITQYRAQMNDIDPFGRSPITYAIIDLSKISKVTDALKQFLMNINVKNSYNNISKIRANAYQYGYSEKAYDMVDLYNFANKFGGKDETTQKLLSAISEAVVYNYTNLDKSYGLSVYFPYYSAYFIDVYSKFENFAKYFEFIKEFIAIKRGGTNKMAFEDDPSSNVSSIKANTEFGLYLTDEDLEIYAKANYRVFKKAENGYMPVYISYDVKLDEKTGYLTINYNNKGLDVNDEIKSIYLNEINRNDKFVTYNIPVKLYKDNGDSYDASLTYVIDLEKNEGNITLVTLTADLGGSYIGGNLVNNSSVVKLSDYKYIEFSNKEFQITNPDGSYRSDWILLENHSLKYEISDFKMSLVDLSDDDNYVAVVEVLDTYGNGHYTNIIEIEN